MLQNFLFLLNQDGDIKQQEVKDAIKLVLIENLNYIRRKKRNYVV